MKTLINSAPPSSALLHKETIHVLEIPQDDSVTKVTSAATPRASPNLINQSALILVAPRSRGIMLTVDSRACGADGGGSERPG